MKLTVVLLVAVAAVSDIQQPAYAQVVAPSTPIFSLPVPESDCPASGAVTGCASLSDRAYSIAMASSKIHNEPRQKILTNPNGVQEAFPLNVGPVYRFTPGQELYLGELSKQAPALSKFDNLYSETLRNITREKLTACSQGGTRKPTFEDYAQVYQSFDAAGKMPTPLSLDASDEVFGGTRMGLVGHNLKRVTRGDTVYVNDLNAASTASLVTRVCGVSSLDAVLANNHVFVSDFSNMAKYIDDKTTLDKYGVETRGYFCFHASRQMLLPLAITIVDTGLIYTSDDTPGEWQLAKMAHHAMELSYQQMRHLVEVHLVSIPMEVEMMRTMATTHPIYQLLRHHFFGNFALELAGGRILLEINVPYDKSLAFGARGSLRFLVDEFKNVNVSETLEQDVARRGLASVASNRLVKYGLKYSTMLNEFTRAYTATYYASDAQVAADCELQHWAANMQSIKEIRGFPAQFTTREQLHKFVAQLIFQNAVKHHFMNGIASWHSTAAPFRTPSLWNKSKQRLPTRKGVAVDPLDYAMPHEIVPDLSYLASRFFRPLPREVTLLDVYKNTAIGAQPQLQPAIEKLRGAMADMEAYVVAEETKMAVPMDLFRPSKLPYFSYI